MRNRLLAGRRGLSGTRFGATGMASGRLRLHSHGPQDGQPLDAVALLVEVGVLPQQDVTDPVTGIFVATGFRAAVAPSLSDPGTAGLLCWSAGFSGRYAADRRDSRSGCRCYGAQGSSWSRASCLLWRRWPP